MWFRARNVLTKFILIDYSEREIFKPKLFWLIPSERNVQAKIILIGSERENRSNQNYFDWFRVGEMFKPKLFWLIPSEKRSNPKIALNDSEREASQQICFVWFRVGTVQSQNKWLIASDRNIQSFLQRERVQKHCLLRFFPDCPFAQPDMPKWLVMTRPLPRHKFTVECILFPLECNYTPLRR
jgi:hypothetical protein